jgi:GTPase Era involved in 16S rRNA processing
MRGKIIDQEKKKILASKTMTDKESSTIAERHHQEFENNLALFEQNTFSDPAVEKLCNDFIREE